ncbi:Uncharacterised protein [Bordetella pertussis]|nr:Uncharacterised protein [Bordetella pertussis]
MSFIVATPLSPDEVIRHVITQPITCTPQNADMLGLQAHLFMEFAIHGLHRAFAVLDATLRELPGMFPDSLAPEDLVFTVYENDADIGTVAFAIKHGPPPPNSIQLRSIIRICCHL